MAPLRLLAAEVYETLRAEGIETNLFTGQERRESEYATHTAATVEMANTHIEEYDVAIIGNKWQQFDLDSPYYFNLIGDTLYLNEYGYVKRFYIQELTESSFTLVFTDTDVSTQPVHTYVGSR